MHKNNFNLTPDEKNEHLMLAGKIPEDWKTPEEIKEEAWIYLRIKTAKEKLQQDATFSTPQKHIQSALKDLNILRQQQYTRLSYEIGLKLMAASADGQNKERIDRLHAIRDLLDECRLEPQNITKAIIRRQSQNDRYHS